MYRSLRFDVDAAQAETWSDALLDAGALSIDISDPHAGESGEVARFGEPGSAPALWPLSRVTALFSSAADAEATLQAIAADLGVPLPAAEVREVAEQDWVRATQAQFQPIRIDDGFWIVPSWCAPPRGDAIALRLDPGRAFGTGSHPTTRLCLEWLRSELQPGARVLDYGCGSGILAIAAALLGAGEARGTDVDAQALEASRENARANGVRASFVAPDQLTAEPYDIVVANILANPLVMLAPALAQRVRPGGGIALSGVLADQTNDVAAAYRPWFTLAPWRAADGWVLLAGTRIA